MIDLDPVFNDLSLVPLAENRAETYSRMSNLVSLLNEAPTHRLGSGLRTSESFYLLELEEGYQLNDWLYDPHVSKEESLFMLTLATKSPFWEHIPETAREKVDLMDVSLVDQISDTLKAACILEAPLIGFSHPPWNSPILSCVCEELVDDEVEAEPVTLVNISDHEHFKAHVNWIDSRIKQSVSTTKELWESKEDLFPSLEFCASVEGQLMSVASSDPRFRQIVSKLFELEAYFLNWKQGNFEPKEFKKCNPVSKTTLNKYGDKYTFSRPNGDEVTATWHLYLTPGKGRIYFEAIGNTHKCVVCHIDDKLPDVTYGAH